VRSPCCLADVALYLIVSLRPFRLNAALCFKNLNLATVIELSWFDHSSGDCPEKHAILYQWYSAGAHQQISDAARSTIVPPFVAAHIRGSRSHMKYSTRIMQLKLSKNSQIKHKPNMWISLGLLSNH
jgi:hypothetical protein